MRIPTTWTRHPAGMWCEIAPWDSDRVITFHDNPGGPCRCGATHNYETEPDYRDILVF